MPAPLPRELIEKILGDPWLNQYDLGQCCLLCKSLLDFVQVRLYRELELAMTVFDPNEQSVPHADVGGPDRYLWRSDSVGILETLELSPHLARLVEGAHFWLDDTLYYEDEEDEEGDLVPILPEASVATPTDLLEPALRLLPRLKSLNVDIDQRGLSVPTVRTWLREGATSELRRFSLRSGGITAGVFKILEELPSTVTQLVLRRSFRHTDAAPIRRLRPLPNLHLDTLKIEHRSGHVSASLLSSFAVNAASIKTLSAHLDPNFPVDFSPYFKLRCLSLTLVNKHSVTDVAETIRPLQALTSLTLSTAEPFHRSSNILVDDLTPLIDVLPSSITKLRFTFFLSTEQLISLANNLPLHLIKPALNYRHYDWTLFHCRVADFEAVREAAAKRGVELRTREWKQYVLPPLLSSFALHPSLPFTADLQRDNGAFRTTALHPY
jgi:hypothetical protein